MVDSNIGQADPGVNTTAGSFSLVGAVQKRSATLVRKLEEAGAVILGRTNMDVFASCGFPNSMLRNESIVDLAGGWSPRWGQTLSPFNVDGNVCGSSGGSAVATFLSLAPLSLGTETGWSISCPSSRNGIVGLRPTAGLTSRAGVIPLVHLMDTVGPMVKSVREAAIAMNALAGPDPLDPMTANQPNDLPDYLSGLEEYSLEGVRIGIMREGIWDPKKRVPRVARAAMQRIVDTLEGAGAVVVEPIGHDWQAFKEWQDGEGVHVYGKAVQHAIRQGFDSYLSDLLYSPHGIRNSEQLYEFVGNDEEESPEGYNLGLQWCFKDLIGIDPSPTNQIYLDHLTTLTEAYDRHTLQHTMDRLNLTVLVGLFHPYEGADGGGEPAGYTASFNLPSLTMPAGWWSAEDAVGKRDPREYVYPAEDMPFGMTFIGRRWGEHELLKVGRAYEKLVGGPQVWRDEGWRRVRRDAVPA